MAKNVKRPYVAPNRSVETHRGATICLEDFEQLSMLAEVPPVSVRLAVSPPDADGLNIFGCEAIAVDEGEPTTATLIERGDPIPATTVELVTAIAESVKRHGMMPIPIIEDATGAVIDGTGRRAVESVMPGIAFPVFRLGVELSRKERTRLRLALNAVRKQMTASQFALAVALEYRSELRVGPGQPKKNSPAQGYSRDELARLYGITPSLLDAAITVSRKGGKAVESVFDPVNKIDVTTVAKQITNAKIARALGGSGNPTDLWITPKDLIASVNAAFRNDWHDAFTLPSNPANAPSDENGNPRIYTEADDAFAQPGYKRMWANVPFSQLERSLEWAVRHAEMGQQIYVLCPAATDRPYVQAAIRKSTDCLLLQDRLVFGKPKTDGGVEFTDGAKFGVIILGFNVSTQLLIDNGVRGTLVITPSDEQPASDDAWYEALAVQQQQLDTEHEAFEAAYREWLESEVAA